ncbi:MAG: glycoside hydrolase family 3 N-terminal domain-containing protein [Fimbriimonas sp.]|nr:glycoside hydrolase family 3 N-terminal domain-containing protein [Fimbriimonas sp.]
MLVVYLPNTDGVVRESAKMGQSYAMSRQGVLVAWGGENMSIEPGTYWDPSLELEDRVNDLVSRMSLEEKVSQMGNVSPAIERLGVPEYDWWNECLHGVGRAGRATVFPQSIGMAATWDPELIQKVATAISDEARAKYHAAQREHNRSRYMGLTYWSPTINILRDPRWGRAQETYGEDPYLTSRIGVAFVKGLQGDDTKHLKLVATPKHYAAHSGPEEGRHAFDAVVSKQDLWETYLPAFEATVKEAGAQSVMGAYNRFNGVPCCANEELLNDVLRDRWGFDGFVVSDCGAIENIYQYHGTASSMAEAAAQSVKAGCDLCCGRAYDALVDAVGQGLISEECIDRSVKRLFRARFRLGMFDPDSEVTFSEIPAWVVDCAGHRELSRIVATKSVVLLKNDGILPLKKEWEILYVTGSSADAQDVLLGNYNGFSSQMVSLLEGIIGKVSAGTRVGFAVGCAVNGPHTDRFGPAGWEASEAELIVACLGYTPKLEGEQGEVASSDGNGDRTGVELPPSQMSLLRFLDTLGKPIVLVLTGGSPILLPSDFTNIRAILMAWYPGAQGGAGVADVLFGDANPSGRLPVSFPGADTVLPPIDDYRMDGRTYRFNASPYRFEFGFGLSYTTFTYDHLCLSESRTPLGAPHAIEVDVRNTGTCLGEEVVQAYVTDVQASVRTPRHRLCAFARVELEPGEVKHVHLCLGDSAFQIVDSEGNRVLEPGEFVVYVGGRQPSQEAINSGEVLALRVTI